MLAGLLTAHAHRSAVLAVAGGLAVASMVGMAFGDYLGGASYRRAAVMGAATLLGSFAPAIPVAFVPAPWCYLAGGLLLAVMGVGIAEARPHPRARAYATTFATLAIASGLSAGAALGLGATG